MKILYTSKFIREYKKLSREIKMQDEKRETIFRKDPFHISLGTHKLHGRLKDFWLFSVDFKYRIVFEIRRDKTMYFHSIGDHSVYQ